MVARPALTRQDKVRFFDALLIRESETMAKKKVKKFIAKAVKRPGDLTRKAKNEGKTVSQFCADVGPKASTRTKQQCNLSRTLSKVRPKKKSAKKKK